MLDQTQNYLTARTNQNKPVILAFITSSQTRRVFGKLTPTAAQLGASGEIEYWNGTQSVGDGGTFGAIPTSGWQARVLNFGGLRESLTPTNQDLIASLQQTELGSYSMELDNMDGYFSEILGDHRSETFLMQDIEIKQGFLTNGFDDLVTLFVGKITELVLTPETLTLVSEPTVASGNAGSGSNVGGTVTLFALADDGTGVVARTTYTAAELGTVFATTSWTFMANIIKNDLADAGVIFELENNTYDAVRLQIGIDSNNFLYVTVGSDVQGAATTTTYTSTAALTSAYIGVPLNINVIFDAINQEVTLTVNDLSCTLAAATAFDSDFTAGDDVTIGSGFDGLIYSLKWNNVYYLINNTNDDGLAYLPEILSDLASPPLIDGTWATWG